ncbi:winged helix-turn-helix domain-containing protein [Kocuria coralli]|uniref:winged helix-turn-helix domain-containing protein n=1 Tax=Kocuria coralli TaxID=1461025 RepID=UPI003CCDE434
MLRRPRVFDTATATEEPPRHEDGGEEPATTGAPATTTAPGAVSADTAPAPGASANGTDVLERQGLRIDPQMRSVWLDDDALELTRTEFDLLHTLMGSGRRVRTKADLVRHLRADSLMSEAYVSEADERSVEVHIGNVRRKLGRTGQSAVWIETVRGVGYRMAAGPARPLKP